MEIFYRRILTFISLVLGTLLFSSAICFANDDDSNFNDRLTGDWFGVRSDLAKNGVDISLEYTGDFFSLASGGIRQGTDYLDNIDLKFALDNEKLFGLRGNKALVYILDTNGGKPNSRVGAVQGVDNIETEPHALKLYEAWDEQSFFDDRLSLLFGFHDLNSEFYMTDPTSDFIVPSFQIGQEFVQSGNIGPSIYPNPTLALRVKARPADDVYMMGGVYTVAPDNSRGFFTGVNAGNGLLLIGEAGWTPRADPKDDSSPNKYALGAWRYTKAKADMYDVDIYGNPVERASYGYYALISHLLYHDATGQNVIGFVHAGISDGNTAPVKWTYEAGFLGQGLIGTRPNAEIGLGLSQAHLADKYVQGSAALGTPSLHNEYSFEIFYRDQIVEGLTIQPDVQYIVNPGADPNLSNGLVLGLRLSVSF